MHFLDGSFDFFGRFPLFQIFLAAVRGRCRSTAASQRDLTSLRNRKMALSRGNFFFFFFRKKKKLFHFFPSRIFFSIFCFPSASGSSRSQLSKNMLFVVFWKKIAFFTTFCEKNVKNVFFTCRSGHIDSYY